MAGVSRRDVLVGAAAAGIGLPGMAVAKDRSGEKFGMHFAPHFGMFQNLGGNSVVTQLEFMAAEGFTALEDNGMKGRSVQEQDQIASTMQRLGMRMGVFVANDIDWQNPTLTTGDRGKADAFVDQCKASVEVAKRVNAKWMTVVPGTLDERQHHGYQTANVIEALRRGAEVFEPQGLVMVLEPLNFRDHPRLFLTDIGQAYEICRAVDSPSCKILYDLYHTQIQEGNLIPNIDRAWDETAYFQIGDNPGRKEPLTGEINYKNVFEHIHKKGFTGILGMEHGNSEAGEAGERKLIAAYRACDVE